MAQAEELLKRPLYIFDLPREILSSLQRKGDDAPNHGSEPVAVSLRREDESTTRSTSCALCGVTFDAVQGQRNHVKSDFHGYNMKQKIRRGKLVSEGEFEKLLEDLDESISGSDTEDSEDDETANNAEAKEDALVTLLKKQAYLSTDNQEESHQPSKPKRGSGKSPLLWFGTPLLPSNTYLGIYRAVFRREDLDEGSDIIAVIRNKQLGFIPASRQPSEDTGAEENPSAKGPHFFLCMIGGGHFAAMVVSLAPRSAKKGGQGSDERQVSVLAHKTFHRYTTRRKQGGAQSASDAAKGAAHSAGSSLRRYNEVALTNEIRELLSNWKSMIDSAELLFVRATGNTNRRALYGPYEGQVLRHSDPRIRGFPFTTRRATQAELMRAFVELTRAKVSRIDQESLAPTTQLEVERVASSSTKAGKGSDSAVHISKLSPKEDPALAHTIQLQTLIRRRKAPGVLSYLFSNSLPPDFLFQPAQTQQNHHAPTPLHLAASVNAPAVVIALLTKAGADPTLQNGEGKTPFELTGDRSTRDAFRIARTELGEYRWNWDTAKIPAGLSKADAQKRDEQERKDAAKKETERRRTDMARLKEEQAIAVQKQVLAKGGSLLGSSAKTGAEKREEEARGMTPELRLRLERERRARAAEERLKRMREGGEAAP